jgi:RNA polymerase sigma factor (sigma-70 family)
MAEFASPTPDDLNLLEQVARAVARARRLAPHDADDFVQSVHLRMAERDYAPLRQFEGRSSLRTYLTVVVARLLKDWQNHEYGKWRPCAAASRLGPIGIAVDRAMNRDGVAIDEAVMLVSSLTGAPVHEVRLVANGVPRRGKRALVPMDDAVETAAVAFSDPVAAEQRQAELDAARRALSRALNELPRDDARLLARRYVARFSVADLAQQMRVDAKQLYRRFDRIRRDVRARMAVHGSDAAPLADSPIDARATPSRGYSARSATIGSTSVARRAGRYAAAAATPSMSTTTPAKLRGSVAVTS